MCYAANELTSQVVKGVTVSYAYDQFGRLTQKSKTGSRVANFYYNYGDKLTKVSYNFQGEGTVTYTYSGDQKRRSRSVSGGAMTKYRVDQGFGVVNEENSGGTLLSTYIHHPGRQIGTVLATSEGSTASSGTWNYYFQDAIGSTRSLWDEDGDRLGKYDYTPFGGKYGNTGEEITRKFTGHDWDNEARLYHTAYRQYSPDTGRWLTRDPLGMVDGPNVYAYVVNNPVSRWDANGLLLTEAALWAIGFLLGLSTLVVLAIMVVLLFSIAVMFAAEWLSEPCNMVNLVSRIFGTDALGTCTTLCGIIVGLGGLAIGWILGQSGISLLLPIIAASAVLGPFAPAFLLAGTVVLGVGIVLATTYISTVYCPMYCK